MTILNIDEAFSSLSNCFISMEEYNSAIRKRELEDYDALLRKSGFDDFIFEREYPSHPLAYSNRSKRIGASDKIRNYVLDGTASFTSDQINALHNAAFDCCAAVRESVVIILAHLRLPESVIILRKLSGLEPATHTVMHSYINEAICVIEGRRTIQETNLLAKGH